MTSTETMHRAIDQHASHIHHITRQWPPLGRYLGAGAGGRKSDFHPTDPVVKKKIVPWMYGQICLQMTSTEPMHRAFDQHASHLHHITRDWPLLGRYLGAGAGG